MTPVEGLVDSNQGVVAYGSRTTALMNEWIRFENHCSEEGIRDLNIRANSLHQIEENVHNTF